MIRIKTLVIALILSSLSSCIQPKEAPQKKLIGINGEAIYVFDEKGSITMLFKEKYNVYEFAVLIDSDTVRIGSEFVSLINVVNRHHKVVIESPTREVLMDTASGFTKYRYKPLRTGVHDFKGTIEYDSSAVTFDYKFIVVGKSKKNH